MPRVRRVSREAISDVARRIVTEQGIGALTYQGLADRLGVTKQAIIYWYPSKADLARELVIPGLEGEAAATIAALQGSRSAPDAIDRFARALAAYHLGDLERFRMLYMSSQVDRGAREMAVAGATLETVHAVTGRMYGALEQQLAADRAFAPAADARRLAVAAHMAVVGFLTMVALADSIADPLAHAGPVLLDALVALLTARTHG